MRCARAIAGPKVDFQTQPVFDEERHHSDDDGGGGVEAHPKIIGMTDSEGKGGREGRLIALPQSFLALTGQSAPLF